MNRFELFDYIKKDFPNARWAHSKCIQVDFMDVMIDPYNYAYAAILLMPDKVLLTDFADTAQIVDFTPEEFQKICQKYGVIWDDYNLELEYHSNEDIKTYKAFMNEISDLNWKKNNY